MQTPERGGYSTLPAGQDLGGWLGPLASDRFEAMVSQYSLLSAAASPRHRGEMVLSTARTLGEDTARVAATKAAIAKSFFI